jgi:hypothetical protein
MPEIQHEPERGALSRLEERFERGVSLSRATEISHGKVGMWTASVRAPLREIFGQESALFADWPSAAGPLPIGDAHTLLTQRLARLGTLISSLRGIEKSVQFSCRRVFIGHGGSPVWHELKDFLQDRLHLPWEEFNRESTAGIATSDRLVQMLDSASFAFLILTAEDEHADSTVHARENVVHEVGLFQGKLGRRKAIILLEDGCTTFSNIHGLTYIGFPRNRIGAAFEEVRRVLDRERISA